MAESAIVVSSVSKRFLLPHERTRTVKQMFTGLLSLKSHNSGTKRFALQGIDLQIEEGEFFGIVGRNGSGKSTLLKILAGIYQPTHGKVSVRGRLVPFIELGVGFNPELTGRENVFLNGALLGFSNKEVAAMYNDVVSFAELEPFMDQKLKNYSSGMQVRLAFSMAIRADADILLIDEVLAVGDAAFQRKCLDYFRKLKKEKKTVVFVSHDMDSVRQFCDRAALIEKSKMVKIGSADEIAELYSELFTREAEEAAQRAEDKPKADRRWGSGAVQFDDIYLKTKVITDKVDYVEFGGVMKINQTIDGPVVGFRISDGSGRAITGTNSKLLQLHTKNRSAGEVVPFKWRVPNIFSNGNYEIGLAVIDQDSEHLDVWNGALVFEVVKHQRTPYIVTPPLELVIDKEDV